MPRPTITTTFTPRVKPVTIYEVPRDRENSPVPVTFDSTEWSFDSTLITFDMTNMDLGPISTNYISSRYGQGIVEDIAGNNILDLSGQQVQGITGGRVNKIDTFWE